MSAPSEKPLGRLRMWLQRPWVLHPFLVGIPPILEFTYKNRTMAEPTRALYPIALTIVPTIALLLLLQLVFRNPRKAGAIASLWVLGFHVHGHVGDDWAEWMWGGIILGTVLFAAWRGSLEVATTFFNLFAILALATPTWELVEDWRAPKRPLPRGEYLTSLTIEPTVKPEERPDIYYIVLDGYGRADVLEEYYGFHNDFVDVLEAKGFYVADHAHSNYAQTALSFASALNMEYVDNLLTARNPKSTYRLTLGSLIAKNRVVEGLRKAGYRIVAYPGEYSLTHLADPDESRRPWLYFTEFEYILFNNTALLPLCDALSLPQARISHAIRRNHIQYVFDDLKQQGPGVGPTFTYVHLVVPHPPFVFKPDGSYRTSRTTATFADGSGWRSRAKRYKEKYDAGYRDQAKYVNRQLEDVVDAILAKSKRPPVILIQGDHGPALKLDWSSKKKSDMRERMSILSAYYIPGGTDALWDDITPVNSFRVVFNEVLGTHLPMLEDKSYFEIWARPYQHIDVTKEVADQEN